MKLVVTLIGFVCFNLFNSTSSFAPGISNDSTRNKPFDGKVTPTHITFGHKITQTKNGVKDYVFRAGKTSYYEDGRFFSSDSTQIHFYNDSGSIQSKVYSLNGYTKENLFYAFGNVKVIKNDSTYLYVDTLFYENRSEVYYSNNPFLYISSNDSLMGDTFISDRNMNVKCGRNIRLLNYSEKDSLQSILKSDSAFILTELSLYKASSNVFVTDNKKKRLYTEELFYDEKKKEYFSNVDILYINDIDTLWAKSFVSDLQLDSIIFKDVSWVHWKKKS